MKKIMIVPVALLLAGASLNAQNSSAGIAKANMNKKEARAEKKEAKKELRKLEGNEVSSLTKDHFYQDFGDARPTWRRTTYFDEATFMKDGKPITAYYDNSTQLVGTTSLVDFSSLAMKVQNDIKKHYPEYTVDRVILFDDNEATQADMIMYGSIISDEDNYFVELTKNQKTIILKVTPEGDISFYTDKK
ncbi:MAG: hypothetical protein ACTHMV_02065 [Chitinophagaceae bacterium]